MPTNDIRRSGNMIHTSLSRTAHVFAINWSNAVYPHRHHLSAKVRTFIDMLAHHSAEQQRLINPYS
jgi:hypothetical protein